MPSNYTYDAENRLAAHVASGVTYTYDGDGKRVKKSNGKLYWPGLGLDAVTESDLSGNITGEYVFFNGKRVAMTELSAVPNHDFEQGSTGWSLHYGASLITDAAKAHSGEKYVQLSTNGPWSGTMTAYLAVAPGQVVRYGGWIYREYGNAPGVNWALKIVDASYQVIQYVGTAHATSGQWEYRENTFTMPAGAAWVQVYCQISGATEATVVRCDDGFLTGQTKYYFADHLGSSRVVTSATGVILDDEDFYPFGGIVPGGTSTSGQNYKFTGKERDSESGLDYFGARYYGSGMGRFTSVDPDNAGVREHDPQSWNAYAYARNNPLLYVDPDGMRYELCDTRGNCVYDYSDADFDRNFRGDPSIELIGDAIYKDGHLIGFFQRLSFDDLSPMANALYAEMAARRDASLQMTGVVLGTSALAGAGIGAGGVVGAVTTGVRGAPLLGPTRAVDLLMRVHHQGLRNIIKDLYRVAGQVGDGGTAHAIHLTRETGRLVGGSDHIIKGQQYVRALERVLRDPKLSLTERGIARTLLQELKNALR